MMASYQRNPLVAIGLGAVNKFAATSRARNIYTLGFPDLNGEATQQEQERSV
jgi:hypothetical protein